MPLLIQSRLSSSVPSRGLYLAGREFGWSGNAARKQFSPLIVAAIVSVGVTGAAILLNSLGTYGEQALGSAPASLLGSAPLPTVPTDATSTTLLYVALGLAALSATVAGVNAC